MIVEKNTVAKNTVAKNTVVTFHYRLSDAAGELLETSREGDPLAYLYGSGGILKTLEKAMAGKQAGERFSVTLTPEQAYGERREGPGAVQRIPLKRLPGGEKQRKFRPGQTVRLNTREGPREVTVVKVGRFNVDVDVNHPLAGKALTFDVEIVGVRTASDEELTHGHAHGVGGHQH